jgi:hypothetical protein
MWPACGGGRAIVPHGPAFGAYDGRMAAHEQIPIAEVIADPEAVFDRIEADRVTLSVMRGNEPVAVISPAPIAETLADLHRALQENPPSGAFFLDVIETRRMLGL